MAAVWYQLGLQLGVRPDALDVIESNYPRDTNMCKVKMFAEWLRSDTDPNYETLVKALAAIGKKSLAESVCIDQGRHKVATKFISTACSIATLCFNLQVFHCRFYLLWMLLTPVSRMTEVLIISYTAAVILASVNSFLMHPPINCIQTPEV